MDSFSKLCGYQIEMSLRQLKARDIRGQYGFELCRDLGVRLIFGSKVNDAPEKVWRYQKTTSSKRCYAHTSKLRWAFAPQRMQALPLGSYALATEHVCSDLGRGRTTVLKDGNLVRPSNGGFRLYQPMASKEQMGVVIVDQSEVTKST